MRIGTLAGAVGVTAKTVRFYEQRGLLPAPPRTSGGYRDYSDEVVQRLRFIRDAQSAGLALAEIQHVLDLRDSGRSPCGEVTSLIVEHLQQVERQLTHLRAVQSLLHELARTAAQVDPASCTEAEVCVILARPPDPRRAR
jgi:DNA-binding transcriptional MerR regulator